jgi:hypothetical protein
MSITVGGADVTGVVFRLRPHVTLTGQLVIETDPSGAGAQAPARFQIQIDPARARPHSRERSSAAAAVEPVAR